MTAVESIPLPLVSVLVYDALVFVAISYRLAAHTITQKSNRCKCFRLIALFQGKGLYELSRSLLQTGLLYYLSVHYVIKHPSSGYPNIVCLFSSTFVFFFVTLAVVWIPLASPGGELVFITTHIGFTNLMACRVFRGVALGMIYMEPHPNGLTTTRIANAFQLVTVLPERTNTVKTPIMHPL